MSICVRWVSLSGGKQNLYGSRLFTKMVYGDGSYSKSEINLEIHKKYLLLCRVLSRFPQDQRALGKSLLRGCAFGRGPLSFARFALNPVFHPADLRRPGIPTLPRTLPRGGRDWKRMGRRVDFDSPPRSFMAYEKKKILRIHVSRLIRFRFLRGWERPDARPWVRVVWLCRPWRGRRRRRCRFSRRRGILRRCARSGRGLLGHGSNPSISRPSEAGAPPPGG